MNEIVVYNNGEIELNVDIEKESIWLNQKQIVQTEGKRRVKRVSTYG